MEGLCRVHCAHWFVHEGVYRGSMEGPWCAMEGTAGINRASLRAPLCASEGPWGVHGRSMERHVGSMVGAMYPWSGMEGAMVRHGGSIKGLSYAIEGPWRVHGGHHGARWWARPWRVCDEYMASPYRDIER